MRVSLNAQSALQMIRSTRRLRASLRRCDGPCVPDASPRKKWTRALVEDAGLMLRPPGVLDVAVPTARSRIQSAFASNTVYKGLPSGSFLDAGEGVTFAGPELVFCEMARVMPCAVHVLLGYELCGGFARDPLSPRMGAVTFGLSPATSVERIGELLDALPKTKANLLARERLAYVRNNAWSPMEAVIATMAALPVHELGYDLGGIELNRRIALPGELVRAGSPSSRVPDIELCGIGVGINYDGREHLDLLSADSQDELERAAAHAHVREKYLDDLRRNRELAAVGMIALPATSEDLFGEGALDAFMLEVIMVAEWRCRTTLQRQRDIIRAKGLKNRRQELIWSLLPWAYAGKYAALLASGSRESSAHARVMETWVEF